MIKEARMRDLFDDDNDGKDSSDFAQMFEDSMTGVGRKLTVGDKIRSFCHDRNC
jgi:hypothetical protein